MTSPRKISEIQIKDLQPGDILLFRPSPHLYTSQQAIIFFQSLSSFKHGHNDTTHSALCVENDSKEGPIIAHITQSGDRQGYFKHSLSALQKDEEKDHPDNTDRPFLVFRPKNQNTAKLVADIAGDAKANEKIQWSTSTLIKPLFRPSFWCISKERPQLSQEKTMPTTAICTEFVIKAIQVAEYKRIESGETITDRLYIRPGSTPKELEAYLYNDRKNYDLFVYPGRNPFHTLFKTIHAELNNIKTRHYTCNLHSKNKRKKVALLCEQIAKKYERGNDHLSELDRCLELLGSVMPILNKHSGFCWFGLKNTDSYNAVKSKARKMGIFERDFRLDAKNHLIKEPSISAKTEMKIQMKRSHFFSIR